MNAFFLFFCLSRVATAATLLVSSGGSGTTCSLTRCSIDTALSLALDGDTISLLPGTYTGCSRSVTKSVVVVGEGGGVALFVCDSPGVFALTIASVNVVLTDVAFSTGTGTSNGVQILGTGAKLARVQIEKFLVGLVISGDGASVDGCAFTDCTRDGGLQVFSNNCVIKNTVIARNFGGQGGGAAIASVITTLQNVSFISNSASSNGGCLRLNPGGVITILSSLFRNCSVSGGPGGGIFIPGGSGVASSVTIQDTDFVDCSGSEGGGIYMREQSTFNLTRVTFSNCPSASVTALNAVPSSVPVMSLSMTNVQFCSGLFLTPAVNVYSVGAGPAGTVTINSCHFAGFRGQAVALTQGANAVFTNNSFSCNDVDVFCGNVGTVSMASSATPLTQVKAPSCPGLPSGTGFCDKTILCAPGAPTSFVCSLGPPCTCNAAGWCSFAGDVGGATPVSVQSGSVLTVQGNVALQGALSVQATVIAPVFVATGAVALAGPLQLSVDPSLSGNMTFPVTQGGVGGLTGQFSSVAVLGAPNCTNITSQQSVATSVLSVTLSINNGQCSSASSLSVGVIAGIVVGVVAAGVIVAASVAIARFYANRKHEKDFSATEVIGMRNGSPYISM